MATFGLWGAIRCTVDQRSRRLPDTTSRGRRRPWSDAAFERGQSLPIVALMMPVLLAVVGLALDGGIVFDARRELQNVADTAAHAGATEIDAAHFQRTGGALALDARGAVGVAVEYVADYNALHRPDQQATLDDVFVMGADRLVVRVSRVARTAFLRVVGVTSVRITAEAAGTARAGGA